MPYIDIVRSRPIFALTTLALCAFGGVGWALQGFAHADPPSPSDLHRPTQALTTGQTPKTASEEQKPASIHFASSFHGNSRTNTYTGHDFTYKEEDATITGDNARCQRMGKAPDYYYILDTDGHLVFDDPSHHATGDKAHIDDQKKVADITGNVVMVLKPKADAANAGDKDQDANSIKKHGATVTCDHVEDHYKQKYVKLFGHLMFKQHFVDTDGTEIERILTAEHGEYDGKAETLVLYPPVDGHDNPVHGHTKGNTFHSDQALTIGTKEGDESIDGNSGTITFYPNHDQDEGAQTATTTDTKSGSAKTAGKDTGSSGTNPPPANPPKGHG